MNQKLEHMKIPLGIINSGGDANWLENSSIEVRDAYLTLALTAFLQKSAFIPAPC